MKRTGKTLLVVLLTLGVAAAGIAAVSNGFKDFSKVESVFAPKNSNNNSGASSGSAESASSSSQYEGSNAVVIDVPKNYFTQEGNLYDTLTVTAMVDSEMTEKDLACSLSWNNQREHSEGDPSSYVTVSNKVRRGNTTTFDVDCIAPFRGDIGVVVTNAYGGSSTASFHIDAEWQVYAAHPFGRYRSEQNSDVNGNATIKKWISSANYDGKSNEIIPNDSDTVYSVSDSNWFALSIYFFSDDNYHIPGEFQEYLGNAAPSDGSRPRTIDAEKAAGFIEALGLDDYFIAYGGFVQEKKVHLGLSIKNDNWGLNEAKEIDDLPFTLNNLIATQTSNMVFGDAGISIRRTA